MIFLLIILIITCILNTILTNLLPFTYQNLSLFTPMFLIALIPIINYFIKDKKQYFIIISILAIIHDLLYSEVFLLTFILIIIIAIFNYLYFSKFKFNFINLLLMLACSLIFYDTSLFLILSVVLNYNYVIWDLIYKITHSFLSNTLLVIFIYEIIFLKGRKKTYNNHPKFRK